MSTRVEELIALASTVIAVSPIAAAFAALDERLASEVARMREGGALSLDELRGLYATEERVLRALSSRERHDIALRQPMSTPLDDLPPWRALASLAPSPIERDLVLLALAREVRLEYETVLGYLNDDLTRRWPTRALATRLLATSDEDASLLRSAMSERAPLFAHGILRCIDESGDRSWLATGIAVTPLATALLVEAGDARHRIPDGLSVLPPIDEQSAPWLARLDEITADRRPPVVMMAGRPGVGRTTLARQLGASRDCVTLSVDIAATTDRSGARSHERATSALRAALLWQRLADAVIVVSGVESWLAGESATSLPTALTDLLAAPSGAVVVRLDRDTRWHDAFSSTRAVRLDLPHPSAGDVAKIWIREAARANGVDLSPADALTLADRFTLTPGRVARVIQRAADEGALDRSNNRDAVVRSIASAARAETRDALGALAQRASTPSAWDDLVLPVPTMRRLREFAMAIRDRPVVLDTWGFGHRVVRSRGLSALFAGASGTGKTTAAGIIARELELDLFVIDLSMVVSKYIGETEKNLDRVFRAARDAGAILFFDEADALFGKRSEVKDARDRYANTEVAYLLQQMENDTIVILATNLARNLDAAFSRRIRYAIEFPAPGEADRLRLWRGIFPAEAPLDRDVDLGFLAAQFALTGGDIRNVALEAAHLAAADECSGSRTIAMRHLVRAMARQLVKQGKTPSAAEFRQFVSLLDRDS